MTPALHLPDTVAAAALGRLLTVAHGNTGQSDTVASFLLAWWNAKDCGGWNLADLWAVDSVIADDMVAVVRFISRNREYPDAYGLGGEFVALVTQWRPHLCAGPK